MFAAAVMPDSVSCGAAISACEKGTQWHQATAKYLSLEEGAVFLDYLRNTNGPTVKFQSHH